MSGDENSAEPGDEEPIAQSERDGEIAAAQLVPFRKARTAMLLVCVILALGSLASLGSFGHQLYKFLDTAGAYVPTTVPWPNVVGHLIRAGVLGLICWQLIKLLGDIDAKTGALSEGFSARHCRFWRVAAWVLPLFAGYAVFEAVYNSNRDVYGPFFRPEFESGYVEIKPNRIEFRRGSETVMRGWMKTKVRNTENEIFVSPAPEITGRDIRRAVIRIAQIFPGSQSVNVHIQFTEEGARKIEQLTREHVTNPLAVLVDGELRAAPRVFSPISGDAQLSNVFTLEEAARMIREGADK